MPLAPLDILRGDEIAFLAKSVQEMERNLPTDKLTDLPNRNALLAHIMYRERCVILQIPLKFCLLFIDLGRFKVVNDELGHDTGDQVAIEAARCLHAGLQGDDEVARFGGDEFVT